MLCDIPHASVLQEEHAVVVVPSKIANNMQLSPANNMQLSPVPELPTLDLSDLTASIPDLQNIEGM